MALFAKPFYYEANNYSDRAAIVPGCQLAGYEDSLPKDIRLTDPKQVRFPKTKSVKVPENYFCGVVALTRQGFLNFSEKYPLKVYYAPSYLLACFPADTVFVRAFIYTSCMVFGTFYGVASQTAAGRPTLDLKYMPPSRILRRMVPVSSGVAKESNAPTATRGFGHRFAGAARWALGHVVTPVVVAAGVTLLLRK